MSNRNEQRARLDLGLALLLIRAARYALGPKDAVSWAHLEQAEETVRRVKEALCRRIGER